MKAGRVPNSTLRSTPEFFSRQVSDARRFYLNLKPSRKTPLSLVSGGLEYCLPDYKIQRPGFPFYSMEYVIRGRGSLKLKGQNHPLKPGAVFSYGPGVAHQIVADAGDPPVKYFVDFSGASAKEILRASRLPAGNVLQIFPPHGLQNLFDEMIYCGQRGAAEICLKLLECIALRIEESRVAQESTDTLSFMSYQQCRRHVEANFQRIRTLAQLAEECRLDEAYLCRLFQRYDHQTPYQFLMRLKMNLAAEWLEQPGALVKQVAERAGFRDQFHFSRAFKKVFGVAPRVFRRIR